MPDTVASIDRRTRPPRRTGPNPTSHGAARPRVRASKDLRPALETLEARWLLANGSIRQLSGQLPARVLAGLREAAAFSNETLPKMLTPDGFEPPAEVEIVAPSPEPVFAEPPSSLASRAPLGPTFGPGRLQVQRLSVPGSLEPGQYVESLSFRVPPGTVSMEFELRPSNPRATLFGQLRLRDEAGRLLAVSALAPGNRPLGLTWRPPAPPVSGGVGGGGGGVEEYHVVLEVVMIAMSFSDSTVGGGAGSETSYPSEVPIATEEGYRLILRRSTRVGESSDSSVTGGGVVLPHPSSPSIPSGSPSVAVAAVVEIPALKSLVASAAPLYLLGFSTPASTRLVTSPVSTGRLPSQSSAASGGVFEGVDARPIPDPRDPAVVDMALIELPGVPEGQARPAGAEPDAEPEPERLVERPRPSGRAARPAGPMVALRGPGGFPMVGTMLLTETPTRIDGLVPQLPSLEAGAPGAGAKQEDSRAGAIDSLAAEVLGADVSGMASDSALGRTSLVTGIVAALALAFVPSLPDLNRLFRRSRARMGFRPVRSLVTLLLRRV